MNQVGAYGQAGSSAGGAAGPKVLEYARVEVTKDSQGRPIYSTQLALTAAAQAKLQPIFKTLNFDISKVKFSFGVTGDGDAFTLNNHVIIDKKAWQKTAPLDQAKLLAHEMAHSVQYSRYGGTDSINAGIFLTRYALQGRVYGVPGPLSKPGTVQGFAGTPFNEVNIMDTAYTFDQLADRVAQEVVTWP